MSDDFKYYLIYDVPVGRTPMLSYDENYGSESEITGFLWDLETVADDHVIPLEFLQRWKKVDMDTDCLDLDGWNVFSRKIKDALDKHMPIKYLQLVEASIMEGKYPGFYVANVHQRLRTFDEKLCKFDEDVCAEGEVNWEEITKIALDEELLSGIPLEERLVYVSEENVQFILYHKSVVDIIKSVYPVGAAFIPVEEWHEAVIYECTKYMVTK